MKIENRPQKAKRLTLDNIDSCPQIQDWLLQFPSDKQLIAKMILAKLQFISRDVYSDWLLSIITELPSDRFYALYSVRKLNNDQTCLWNEQGQVIARPGVSLGSEDLVYSLIANIVRSKQAELFDHPSICCLRDKKIHDIILIDDSIGSGDRVSYFISAMMRHKTFLSWWSFGLIKIHIISFARTIEGETKIITNLHGSDHCKRKFRKSSKVFFISDKVYNTKSFESRWDKSFNEILHLCDQQTAISKWARRGYGSVMANIVFYHSVPNNLPGMIWFNNVKWKGLFPSRTIPDWLLALFDNQHVDKQNSSLQETKIPYEIVKLLKLVKRGVRSTTSVAMRLNCDHRTAIYLMEKAKISGFLSENYRLTKTGYDQLKQLDFQQSVSIQDRLLYIPDSWCVDEGTIQPSCSENFNYSEWTDSVEDFSFTDGEVGQTSLARSDDKAALPPFSVAAHLPAGTRICPDTDGPMGSKER